MGSLESTRQAKESLKAQGSVFITIHGNKTKNTKEKVKSEKPLEVLKRAIDPIQSEPPQDQSQNHKSKSN